MAKDMIPKSWALKLSPDGRLWSTYPDGTRPAVGEPFFTQFNAIENPISENGAWDHSASTFQLVRTTAGFACGAAYTETNNDNYARLVPAAFTAPSDNYEVTATVRIVNPAVTISEIELLLRLITDATTMQAYEVQILTSGAVNLIRINGSPGSFAVVPGVAASITGWTGDGDKVKARVTGTNPVVITMWHAPASAPAAFTQYLTYSDVDATRKQSGQPAMGFYQHAVDSNLLNAGWADFSVVAV